MGESRRGMGRRFFLQLSGATGLAMGCNLRRAPEKLIPYLVPPEDGFPGTPVFYRTACRACSAGCGATARTREGRVIKLEGNPDDPISRGALCALGQASLQALYSPDRFKGPQRRDASGKLSALSWDEATELLAKALWDARAKGKGAVRLLTRPEPGSAGALQKAFLGKLGAGERIAFEPFELSPLRAASAALFGKAELPAFDLSAARSVVSFGADLSETWLSPVELSRQLGQGRGRVGPQRTRLVWVGPRLSTTGTAADAWIRCRAGSERWLALGLLRWIVDPANKVAGLSPGAAALHSSLQALDPAQAEAQTGVPGSALARWGAQLASRRPSAILGPGMASLGEDATELAAAILLLNHVLGNVGRTVLYGQDPLEDPPSPFSAVQSLVADLGAGKVSVLLLHHVDLAGALPSALGAAGALSKVPLVVSFSSRPDASSGRAHLVLPDDHPLEAFGDVVVRKGVVQIGQPVMQPVGDSRSASQVLVEVAAKLPDAAAHLEDATYYDFFQKRLASLVPPGGTSAEEAQRAAQERGGVYAPTAPAQVSLDAGAARPFLSVPPPVRPGTALVGFPTASRGDGRDADLPWLRELPDPLTAACWTDWVELHPDTARRLEVRTGEAVRLTTPQGRVELPAYVTPTVREDAAAVPIGSKLLGLLPAAADARSGALAWRSAEVVLARVGSAMPLPLWGPQVGQEGRELVRAVSEQHPEVVREGPAPEMYPKPNFTEHRWAMAIDLDRCTGCQACVVACYAENNVPVVGPELVSQGRGMAWLRIERYLEQERGAVRADLLPMLCQHCGNAPCEPVCPVYATYTTPEGLAAQVYNRCVGTRYCSNNCPYKVRVFNWFDPKFAPPLNLQLNPEVTVRARGVMEKCSFCVQRIKAGENAARNEGRRVRDGEVVPACVQTCPAQAMVFGDADDPGSRVFALQRDGRGYGVLGELNTLPAITYLAKVREEEP